MDLSLYYKNPEAFNKYYNSIITFLNMDDEILDDLHYYYFPILVFFTKIFPGIENDSLKKTQAYHFLSEKANPIEYLCRKYLGSTEKERYENEAKIIVDQIISLVKHNTGNASFERIITDKLIFYFDYETIENQESFYYSFICRETNETLSYNTFSELNQEYLLYMIATITYLCTNDWLE